MHVRTCALSTAQGHSDTSEHADTRGCRIGACKQCGMHRGPLSGCSSQHGRLCPSGVRLCCGAAGTCQVTCSVSRRRAAIQARHTGCLSLSGSLQVCAGRVMHPFRGGTHLMCRAGPVLQNVRSRPAHDAARQHLRTHRSPVLFWMAMASWDAAPRARLLPAAWCVFLRAEPLHRTPAGRAAKPCECCSRRACTASVSVVGKKRMNGAQSR